MKKFLFPVLALCGLLFGSQAFAANNMTFSFGTSFVPLGPALFMGQDFNVMVSALNTLRNQADGTTNGVFKGTFNGTVGATTPSTGAFTTTTSSGVTSPVGGVASSGTGQTIAPNLVTTGDWKPLAITDGTSTTCVTTTTYIAQVFVPANMTVTGVSIVNSTAVAGNVEVEMADSTGAVIVATAGTSTAASGTAAYQRIPFAAPWPATGPATYYVMLQCNNTSELFRTHTVGDFRTQSVLSGTYGTFVAFTPATTFTTAVGPIASLY